MSRRFFGSSLMASNSPDLLESVHSSLRAPCADEEQLYLQYLESSDREEEIRLLGECIELCLRHCALDPSDAPARTLTGRRFSEFSCHPAATRAESIQRLRQASRHHAAACRLDRSSGDAWLHWGHSLRLQAYHTADSARRERLLRSALRKLAASRACDPMAPEPVVEHAVVMTSLVKCIADPADRRDLLICARGDLYRARRMEGDIISITYHLARLETLAGRHPMAVWLLDALAAGSRRTAICDDILNCRDFAPLGAYPEFLKLFEIRR